MSKFIFSDYLKQKGFSHSDNGIHQLYEYEQNNNGQIIYYCVNLQGGVMTTNKNGQPTEDGNLLEVDIPIPTTEADAEKWINEFLSS